MHVGKPWEVGVVAPVREDMVALQESLSSLTPICLSLTFSSYSSNINLFKDLVSKISTTCMPLFIPTDLIQTSVFSFPELLQQPLVSILPVCHLLPSRRTQVCCQSLAPETDLAVLKCIKLRPSSSSWFTASSVVPMDATTSSCPPLLSDAPCGSPNHKYPSSCFTSSFLYLECLSLPTHP